MSAFGNGKLGFDDSQTAPLLSQSGLNAQFFSFEQAPESLRKEAEKGAALVAGLAPQSTLFVRLNAPPLPFAKLRRVLPSLLSVQLPFPVSESSVAFERNESGVFAHVVRKSDLRKRIDALRTKGCDPIALVPIGPAMWRFASTTIPLPSETPRALLWISSNMAVLATGRGNSLETVSSFKPSAQADYLRRIKLAFAGLPDGLSLLLAGSGANDAAKSFPSTLHTIVPSEPEAFLCRALAARGLSDLNLRTDGDAHPALGRNERRLCTVAAILFLAASSFFAYSGIQDWLRAREERSAAFKARTEAVDSLAGMHIAAKGESALAIAREAAEQRRDPLFETPIGLAPELSALSSASTANGIRISHVELSTGRATVSGNAPDTASVNAFEKAMGEQGVPVVVTEEPRAVPDGGVSFFVSSKGDARK